MTFNPLDQAVSPQLVMFDLDGTLVDSVPDLYAAVIAMQDRLGHPRASFEALRSWVGNGAEMLVKRALSGQIEPLPIEPNLFESAYALFLRHYAAFNGRQATLYEGARALLDHLREQSLPIAIITNKPEAFTLPLLSHLGLCADQVLSGDSLPQKKPHPAPLQHCLSHFHVDASAALMVGDSRSDIDAARACRVPCIAVSYGYNHGQAPETLGADRLVDSLRELIRPMS